ncbi:hypothetical protein [Streptomyces sp. BP-8]|uniref:Uncharacterized protein n=1 Tax=Streptomyces sirii TaxID=3127701 RepID=A0ABZ2QXB2_9ACTN
MSEAGYEPPQSYFLEEDQCIVRFVAEQDGKSRSFDFMKFGLAGPLRGSFTRAVHAHTGTAGQIKSLGPPETATGRWATSSTR